MYFPRVNSNIFSNSLENLANYLISLKLEIFIEINPVVYSFYGNKNKNKVEIGLQKSN
jgi:hypothetical protein